MWRADHKKTVETFKHEFRSAYLAHQDAVLQAAYRIIRNLEDAEDILQTVFLRLVKSPDIQSEFCKNPKAYLCQAARNEALNVCGARKRKKLADEDITDLEMMAPEPDEDIERIRAAIAGLKPQFSDILDLYYYQGFTCLEISKVRRKPMGTIFADLFRARSELKKALLSQEKPGETKKEKHQGNRGTVFTETFEGTGSGDQ